MHKHAASATLRDPDTHGVLDYAFTEASDHHRSGRLSEAEDLYRKILSINPRHADSLHHLGLIAHAVGRHDVAIELIEKALSLQPGMPNAHYNVALAYRASGDAGAALRFAQKAVAIRPQHLSAQLLCGDLFKSIGALDEAKASCKRALAVDPNNAEANNNLGNVFLEQGQLDEAARCYRSALASDPDYVLALANLGKALRLTEQVDEAIACLERAVAIKPSLTAASCSLAEALLAVSKPGPALGVVLQALSFEQSDECKLLFVHCLRDGAPFPVTDLMRTLLIAAIDEPWGRPGDLGPACVALLKLDHDIKSCIGRATAAWPQRPGAGELFGDGFASVAANPLLRCALQSFSLGDMDIEKFLTCSRAALLALQHEKPAVDASVLAFSCALSQQCFINEYVFAVTDHEKDCVDKLRDRIEEALRSDGLIEAGELACLAAYMPLHSLADSERLLERSWPEPVQDLVTRQIREPAAEKELRETIPRLTIVDDAVSVIVQRQYEENPYPRWMKSRFLGSPISIDIAMRRQFPHSSFRPLRSGQLDVLVAGCGTGQQLVEMARRYSGARVLAIDLSLSSLCYAKLRTTALGFDNIEFGQADILRLGELNRSFDLIDTGGVLHHLANPEFGWQNLVSLLRPDGLMRIALYSEFGRRHIVAAQKHLLARGVGPTSNEIRMARQDIVASADASLKAVTASPDFFSTSTCRDLLLHAQEHRFTLPRIGDFIVQNSLDFLGFDVPRSIRCAYELKFPDDPFQADFGNWHLFEMENPDTFAAMYQFWVQKRPQPSF